MLLPTLRATIFALAGCTLLACAPAAHAQVLDFENLSNPVPANNGGNNDHGSTVFQNGFTLEAAPGSLLSVAPEPQLFLLYTGSVALRNSSVDTLTTLHLTAGGVFTLNTIDLANWFKQSGQPGTSTFVFTGNLFGGGTISQIYTHGANDNLETVRFINFTNLTSLQFTEQAGSHPVQFDNIVLNGGAPVTNTPEPGSLALLTSLSFTGVGLLRRRRTGVVRS